MTQFLVTLQPSGQQFTVQPAKPVLQAGLEAGIALPHGCKSGTCGQCKGKVLQGSVTHAGHSAGALSAEEEQQGYALLCCAQATSDLQVQVRVADSVADIPSRKMPGRIEHLEWPAPDVAVLTMRLPAGDPFVFRPGQYMDIILANGQRRSYSIASPNADQGTVQFHIRHMPGGEFTDALFKQATPSVRERGILRLEGPLGGFYLREDSTSPIVLLASGTGFAPVKGILEMIFAKGLNRADPATGRAARPIVLYWGARSQADLYMHELPLRWQQEQENFSYVPVLSEPLTDAAAQERGVAAWQGRTGLVHEAVMADLPDLSGYQVYACGVPVMVRAAHQDFTARCGLPEDSFFSDAFVSKADSKPAS